MINGVLLARKLCCKGRRVVGDVVDHRGSIGLGVYRREDGEETVGERCRKQKISYSFHQDPSRSSSSNESSVIKQGQHGQGEGPLMDH